MVDVGEKCSFVKTASQTRSCGESLQLLVAGEGRHMVYRKNIRVLDDGALGALPLLIHECRPCSVLEDLAHSFAGLGTAFEIFHCSNLLLSPLALLSVGRQCKVKGASETLVSLVRELTAFVHAGSTTLHV